MRFFKLLLLFLCMPSFVVQAQHFPAQNVRIVVPYAPGGGVDVLARILADRLQQKWGVGVIVDNKVGGATIIGASAVAKSAPDGLTLLFTSEATITSNPFLFEKLPYDPVKDLKPITQIVSLPQMVVARAGLPANTLKELVQLAKAKPNTLSYASTGPGSLPHLLFDGLRSFHDAQITHVPYKGIVPAVTAVLAGEVDLTLAGVPASMAHINAGKLKPLAVAHDTRLAVLPHVPTLQEAGFSNVDPHASWFGLFASGGTSAAVVQKIYKDVSAIGAEPAFRETHMVLRGYEPVFSSPEQFAKFIQMDMQQKGKLIRSSGAKVE